MVVEHVFHLEATWKGGRNSEGEIDAGGLRSVISIPVEMGGPARGPTRMKCCWARRPPVISLH